jgi:hypothetical protein
METQPKTKKKKIITGNTELNTEVNTGRVASVFYQLRIERQLKDKAIEVAKSQNSTLSYILKRFIDFYIRNNGQIKTLPKNVDNPGDNILLF